MKRPRINDIAQRAGVSITAVSFALNGKPGVSDAVRQRILAAADELGWYPNRAARALSGEHVGSVGLILTRKDQLVGVEPWFMELLSGIEIALAPGQVGLLLQVLGDEPQGELVLYHRWWSEHRVDGVMIVDVRVDDPRLPLLERLGMPAVVLSRTQPTSSLPSVWIDERAGTMEAMEHLASLGHRLVARVSGPPDLVHTQERDRAYEAGAARFGIEAIPCVHSDYSSEGGDRATRELLAGRRRPTAILYDNDLMALSAVGVANQLGLAVPDQLSILAWEDSPLCRISHPHLSAMAVDVPLFGRVAAELLLEVVNGSEVEDISFGTRELVVRGSTGIPQEA